jgi:hypothetical protein
MDKVIKISRIKVLNNEVEDFISEYGTIFHSYKFLSSMSNTYRCFVAKMENEIVGVLPLIKSSKYKVLSYNLPPFAYYYGPVIKKGYSIDIRIDLLNVVKNSLRLDFQLKDSSVNDLMSSGFKLNKKSTFIVEKDDSYSKNSISKDKLKYIYRYQELLEKNKIRLVEGTDAVYHLLKLHEKRSNELYFNGNTSFLREISKGGMKFYSNIIFTLDSEPISGVFTLIDENSMYLLSGHFNNDLINDYKNINAFTQYLAINEARKLNLSFDFLGSDIAGVAKFNQSLGGKRRNVLNLVKTNSYYYRILEYLKL